MYPFPAARAISFDVVFAVAGELPALAEALPGWTAVELAGGEQLGVSV